MTGSALTRPSMPSPMVSLREQSTSDLQAAIRSHSDPGATLKRANAVLGLYFDPDNDPETRAAIRQEFVIALSGYPDWAVQRAFDAWVKTGNRRPKPAEIVTLVHREIRPLTDELALRRRQEAEREQHRPALTPEERERRRAFVADLMRNTWSKAAD